MTYPQFVDSLSYGVSLFIDSLRSFLSSLIHNYFIMTLLGLVLFCSLVWLLFNYLLSIIDRKTDDLDTYLEMKKRYSWSQDIAMDYYYLNRFKIYQLKFDKFRMSQLVKYEYLDKYKGDEANYNFKKLILNKVVQNHYMKYRRDLEVDLRMQSFDVNEEVFRKINSEKKKFIKKEKDSNLPSWFGKDIKSKKASKKEQEEMRSMLKDFDNLQKETYTASNIDD